METNFSLNFTNPHFIQNPYKYYEELYTNDSILFDTHAKTWLAFNYDDVKAVLENKCLLLGKKSASKENELPWSDLFKMRDINQKNTLLQKKADVLISEAFMTDADTHFAIKKEVMKVFTPQMLRELTLYVDIVASSALVNYELGQTINLKDDYIDPIVRSAVDYLFGIEKSKSKKLINYAHFIIQKKFQFQKSLQEKLLLTQAIIYIANYTLQNAEDENAQRGPFLQQLVSMYKGGSLSADGLVSNTIFTMGAALESTFASIESIFYHLHQHKDLYQQIRIDRTLIKKFIAESNRLESAASFITRIAAEDTQVNGVKIKKGEQLMCLLGAANRDPKKFSEPNAISLERPNDNSLVFGSGIHYCIGAAVAKIEMEIALKNFMDKFGNFEIISEINWRNDFRFRALQTLRLKV